MKHKINSLVMITMSTFIMAIGIYFFKFPDNFCFGGITGFAAVIAKITPLSASAFTFLANTILLIIGFIYLLEVVSVILQVGYFKISGGKRIFKMAPIHHHFELCGWSETRVVAVFSIVTAILCMIALLGV